MKSDYQNMKEWRKLALIGLFVSICVFMCYIFSAIEIEKERILYNKTISENKDTTFIYVYKEISQWNKFVEALIQVESRGDSLILGDHGNSVGCLQIQKEYVDYVNEFGNKNFTYDDRFSRERSIQIFESMQDLRNKDRNIITAIKIHNPRAGDDYYRKIFTEMFK